MIQIPDEVLNDTQLGFGEKIYFGCLAAGIKPDFGESESTVKRRMKVLRDCGRLPSPRQETESPAAVDVQDITEYAEWLLVRPRKIGSRGAKMLNALIEIHGGDNVAAACRMLFIQRNEPFETIQGNRYSPGLMDDLKGLLAAGHGMADGSVNQQRIMGAFSLVCLHDGIFSREKLRLLGVRYGENAVVDACKRAMLFDFYDDDISIQASSKSCWYACVIQSILEGKI
jgi:hypothetical protein